MKKNAAVHRSFFILVLFLALCFMNSQNVFAGYVSTAPGYAQASHSNASWQRLGLTTNNDGISWSVNGGAYGHDALIAGERVKFKFTMYKPEWGRHSYDAIAVWIDKNKDFDFTDAGERVLRDKWVFSLDPRDTHDDSPANLSKNFYYSFIVPTDFTGDYWMRARVTCNESLNNNLANLNPSGYLWQGEVEDLKFNVKSVPEPTTMLLLGLGLGGAALMRRRFKE